MGVVRDLDRRLLGLATMGQPREARPWLPRISRAGDRGRVWVGVTLLLAATGGRTARRAALRGAGSLAIASLVTNTLVKWTVRRRRPVLRSVIPLVRRLPQQPSTSSFPSGHAASAAAFAAGLALESPRYGAAVAPIAAAVAASRVYVGVHYPSDVLVGALLGLGAAALTCHWWPPRPGTRAGAARPRVPAPALSEGAGLVAVVNVGAGPGNDDPTPTVKQLRLLLPAAEVVPCGPRDDFPRLLAEAAGRAAARGGALGICGGDGSVNAAAQLAAEHHLPLAVLPGGTLDHFALDVGLPTLEDAARAVAAGDAVAVDLGRVVHAGDAGRPSGSAVHAGLTGHFVNTFSVGLYPELVRDRERWHGIAGRWPAAALALARVLCHADPVRVEVNGRPRRLWLLFVGNSVYTPEGFAPSFRGRLDDGLLDVRALDGERPLARSRLILAALTGTLGRSSHVYASARLRRLRLTGLRSVDVQALDGEVVPAPGSSVTVDKLPRALTVYRPAEPQSELVQRARTAAAIARRRRRVRAWLARSAARLTGRDATA